MTGIIFRGIEQENFSILKFYVARANRIIPALAVLCLTILILGYFYFTPWDYKTIGRDVATSMSFLSNIMFSMRGGYFQSEENFLLHTWSLSAEWQFYIIYPLALVAIRKFMSLKAMKVTVLVGAVLGFIFCVVATYKWPNPAYYLLPTRAWEMMIGGVAYLYPLKLAENRKKVFEWVGLVLIIISYVFISKENLWPGYLALIPVLGAFLIIQAQRNDSIVTGNIIFQSLGKWSYSIYLWHWPIAVSFSYYSFNDDYKLLAILLSIILGFISNLLIERRMVKKSLIKDIIKYILIIFSFGVIGSIIFKYQGFPQRMDLVSNPLIQGGTGNDYLIREGTYLINTDDSYDYLLIGDSNANHYVRGVLKEGTKVKHSWYATCMSFPNSYSTRSGSYLTWEENCKNNHKIALGEDTPIIIAESWYRTGKDLLKCSNEKCSLTGDYKKDLSLQLKELIQVYGEYREIYIIGQLPKPENNLIMKCMKTRHYISERLNCNEDATPSSNSLVINEVISKSVSSYENVVFIDPKNAICINENCKYVINNKSIFMTDGSHLSGYGSEVLWKYIISQIEK
jgi:peptidoglycan/LPS O-acetylase OafA/YrhL